MDQQAVTARGAAKPPPPADTVPPPVDVEQAEAAVVEHYAHLTRLAYLLLPAEEDRGRRVLAAHGLVQRSLPRGRTAPGAPGCGAQDRMPGDDVRDGVPPGAVPGQRADGSAGGGGAARGAGSAGGADGAEVRFGPGAPWRNDGDAGAGYAYVRLRIVRAALDAGRPRGRLRLPRTGGLPSPLPRLWGLRLHPRPGGSDELALDRALAALPAPARAAYVLRGLEALPDPAVRRLLAAAGAEDPGAALAAADRVAEPPGSAERRLLLSPEFDPCALQARPTDLLRRRQHTRAALAAAAALVAVVALLGVPGAGGGADDAAAAPYARNAFAEQALDPAQLAVAGRDDWQRAGRADFAAWPARGARTRDAALLRRALAVWARPGEPVRVSATPGTAAGPPAGPPRLLYAGDVDRATVVLFHDGLRLVRYAEVRDEPGAAVLDFARADAADAASALAVVVGRTDGNVRYLTAPWVSGVSLRELLDPAAEARRVDRDTDGVTAPVPSTPLPTTAPAEPGTAPTGTGAPGGKAADGTADDTGTTDAPAAESPADGTPDADSPDDSTATAEQHCTTWPALELRTRPSAGAGAPAQLTTDLGELVPARLTYGPPAAATDVAGAAARDRWARTACHLAALRAHGVRSVNSWTFAGQPLPEAGGTAAWVCTRADTWRGTGGVALAQFQPPAAGARQQGAVAARARDTTACGVRAPHALAGVLWKARSGRWYVLAAGSRDVTSVTASGGVSGAAAGRFLATAADRGARAKLTATLPDGTTLRPPS
ncbi:hypothetical protein [Streptomyces sp. CMB-StM0423]|uniref:hypothetical protein n=1 Tax=Streptomyces sp. CMB-StM0423 TaxID=2059884 RepID=UPI000C6FE3FE|nr:hypothetical protein [Streptomyces sp. CMB-StM0423]AUH43373.1 hypothetical protein CXR04_27285 [Streptomyces sp. CMB-StM0423]